MAAQPQGAAEIGPPPHAEHDSEHHERKRSTSRFMLALFTLSDVVLLVALWSLASVAQWYEASPHDTGPLSLESDEAAQRLAACALLNIAQIALIVAKLAAMPSHAHRTVQYEMAVTPEPGLRPAEEQPLLRRLFWALGDLPVLQNLLRDFLWQLMALYGVSPDEAGQELLPTLEDASWQFGLFLGTDALLVLAAVVFMHWLYTDSDHRSHWPTTQPGGTWRVVGLVAAPAVGYLFWDAAGLVRGVTGPQFVALVMGVAESAGQLMWAWDFHGAGVPFFLVATLCTFTPGAVWQLVAIVQGNSADHAYRVLASILLANSVALQNVLVGFNAALVAEEAEAVPCCHKQPPVSEGQEEGGAHPPDLTAPAGDSSSSKLSQPLLRDISFHGSLNA